MIFMTILIILFFICITIALIPQRIARYFVKNNNNSNENRLDFLSSKIKKISTVCAGLIWVIFAFEFIFSPDIGNFFIPNDKNYGLSITFDIILITLIIIIVILRILRLKSRNPNDSKAHCKSRNLTMKILLLLMIILYISMMTIAIISNNA